jgi:hypothetical protein
MLRIRIPSDTVSSVGRAAHDAGLAALLGGNLYGRIAMHPALAGIGEESERGKLANRAWQRYSWVSSAGLAAIVAGWAGARVNEALPSSLSPRERPLALGKDAAVAAVAVTELATMVTGMRFARSAPEGAVPLTDGETPAHAASERSARLKRRLNALSTASIAAELALVGANAALAQANFRRPPVRRLLRKRY